MDRVFVYWDNSNIFIGAQTLAEEREKSPDARYRARISFRAMLFLARAKRRVEKTVVAGSTPPAAREVWSELRNSGAEVALFDRGDGGKEQEVPDQQLQLQMMTDALRHSSSPGVAVLLTGDGKGREQNKGFHYALELMHSRGWRVELLAWEKSCHSQMREWTRKNGVYVPLDDHYESVTYLEKSRNAPKREAERVDLARRQISR